MADPCADQAVATVEAQTKYDREKKIADKLIKQSDKSWAKMRKDCRRGTYAGKKGKALEKAVQQCSSSSVTAGSDYQSWSDAQDKANQAEMALNQAKEEYAQCRHEQGQPED